MSGGAVRSSHVLPPNIGELGDDFALRSNLRHSGDMDWITELERWRKECPDYKKLSHASFCNRCDVQVWTMPIGGVTWTSLTKSTESYFAENKADKDTKSLAVEGAAAKINKHGQVLSRHQLGESQMSDYIRDLLRMSGGGSLSGRGNFSVPNELLNALAGDEAQEALAKERLLSEMRKQDSSKIDPSFVSLDLMEMEKGDVDAFLSHARKRIIKRGKVGRKACCVRIGGVLDNVLGPEGGEDTLKDAKPEDRGDGDPIGAAESVDEAAVANLRKPRGACKASMEDLARVDDNVLLFIAEEFGVREHSADCAVRLAITTQLSEDQKFVQSAVRRPGALRQHFGLREGEQIPTDRVQAEFNALRQKIQDDVDLSEDESKLFRQLRFFLNVVRPALSEAAAGDLTLKTRPDNKSYPTEPAPVKTGKGKTAGAPVKAKVRSASKALGEALTSFMEAAAGDLELKTRKDNSGYPTELTPVGGANKSKISGKPTPAKISDRGKADPIGAAEQEITDGDGLEEAYEGFKSWDDVLAHVGAGKPVAYHAPMDFRPRRVTAAVKGKRVRVDPGSRDADPFHADQGHLDRFRRPVTEQRSSKLVSALFTFLESHKEGVSAASLTKKAYTAGASARSDNTDAGIKTGLSAAPKSRGVKPGDPIGGSK